MNPLIQKYLQEKYGENFEQDAQKQYDEQVSRSNTGNLFANIGDAIAGKSIGSSNEYFNQVNKQAKENTLGKIENAKKEFMANAAFENQQYDMDRKKQQDTAEDDINSMESKVAQQAALKMGMDPNIASTLTATKFKQSSPVWQKLYEIEQRKLDRQEARDERRFQAGIKLDEKMQGLKTPYGLANSDEDAKKLKDAHEAKKNFDNKLEQMIALRKKHEGGAILNREDVQRGKQLSKDLLLEYKNMAKLGVLSQSDENIINSIIPEDPLEYNSPLAAIQGQDPILNRLESFKSDSDKDFQTRVSTRTRHGIANSGAPQSSKKEVVKTQTNAKTGEKRVVYSDGTFEILKPVAGGR